MIPIRGMKEFAEQWTDSFVPLRVVIQTSSPTISHPFISLDGILSRLIIERLGIFQLPERKDDIYEILLPLEKREHPEFWYWKTSMGLSNSKFIGKTYWTKHFKSEQRLDEEPIEAGRVLTYAMPLIYEPPCEFVFFCKGQKRAVENLLATLKNIGKKRSQGFGRVALIKVEEIEEDLSEFYNDTIMRPIPIEIFNLEIKEGMKIEKLGFRPPYWHPLNQTFCIPPGEKKALYLGKEKIS